VIDSIEGKGTTIRMYLPRTLKEAEALTQEATAVRLGHGETVLVVEDEASVRAVVVDLLTELGYQPLEASTAEEAMGLIQSSQAIDLLITDVGLPGVNGRELAQIARQNRPELPVLFVTGYAGSATVRASFLQPGMDMMSKPFAMSELGAKIGEMVTKS